MSSKQQTWTSPPKTLLDKVVYAIRNQPHSSNGVSRTAILKYLQSEFEIDGSKANQLKQAFKKGVGKGILIQTGQSFRVAGDAISTLPEELKVKIEDIKLGSGQDAKAGDVINVKYVGKLDDGSIFDSAKNFEFTLGQGEVIKGWDIGITSMKLGGVRKLFVPSKFGYGKRGSMPEIPPNADLHFTVTLKSIK